MRGDSVRDQWATSIKEWLVGCPVGCRYLAASCFCKSWTSKTTRSISNVCCGLLCSAYNNCAAISCVLSIGLFLPLLIWVKRKLAQPEKCVLLFCSWYLIKLKWWTSYIAKMAANEGKKCTAFHTQLFNQSLIIKNLTPPHPPPKKTTLKQKQKNRASIFFIKSVDQKLVDEPNLLIGKS